MTLLLLLLQSNITARNIMQKSTSSATAVSLTIRLYFHSFSCCCLLNLPAKFRGIRTYSSSRSSKVIDLGVNRKRIFDFVLVIISNVGRISDLLPFSRYWRLNLENGLFSQHLPCLGIPLEFLDETYPATTRAMWLPYVKNCIILTVFTDPPVWRTDRRTDDGIECAKYNVVCRRALKTDTDPWPVYNSEKIAKKSCGRVAR